MTLSDRIAAEAEAERELSRALREYAAVRSARIARPEVTSIDLLSVASERVRALESQLGVRDQRADDPEGALGTLCELDLIHALAEDVVEIGHIRAYARWFSPDPEARDRAVLTAGDNG